ncbi:MAG: relaxase domain-containing protein [Deltaproteobacteria bacterium]|nr:relaxase domain-containing protein [Deltaproteobacteria bacterium]
MRPAHVSAKQAADYYYAKDPFCENKLELKGEGAEKLGIAGEIKPRQFKSLLQGKDPSGKGDWEVKGAGADRERAGIDIPFSMPKSVSIQAFHSNDPQMQIDMQKAFRMAAERTVHYMQENGYFQYRETINGVTTAKEGEGMYSFFSHSESRAGDPHGHIHTLIYNSVLTREGEVRALHADKIFTDQRHISTIFNSYASKELTSLGYALETRANGTFELAGHNPLQVSQFSTRNLTIGERIKELSQKYPHATAGQIQEMAQKGSRKAKNRERTAGEAQADWNREDALYGISQGDVDNAIKDAGRRTRAEANFSTQDYIAKAVLSLNEIESCFTKQQVISTAAIFSMGKILTPDELQKAFTDCITSKEIEYLGENTKGRGKLAAQVYTSKEMLKVEKEIIKMAKEGQNKAGAVMGKDEAKQALAEWQKKNNITLTAGQKEAAEHILTSSDKITLIQGDAGTGKTTMLKAVKDITEGQGQRIQGLSNTGKAASEIEKASGIESQTAARFLAAEKDRACNHGISIIDETSMMGSKATHDVLKATLQSDNPNAKVVMIGDTKQLQSISAGKIFHDLQTKSGLPVIEMKENIRQTDIGAKTIAEKMSAKEFEEAYNEMEKQGRIVEIPDKGQRHEAIAKDYVKDVVNGKDTILTTATHADRNDLNNKIHAALQEQGKIGKTDHTLQVRESKNLDPIKKQFAGSYERGDVLITNEKTLGYEKGTELKVIDINHQTNTLIAISAAGDEKLQIDLQKEGSNFAVYSEKTQSFTEGEIIIFGKNDKGKRGIGVNNGDIATIQEIDSQTGRITAVYGTGRQVRFNICNYNYFGQGYAITREKSQGQTAEKGMSNVDTQQGTSAQASYVEITRAKMGTILFIDSKENFKKQMQIETEKTSTLDERDRRIHRYR